MPVDLFANAANTTLTAALTAGATSLPVTSSTPFPAVTTAAATQFRVIIDAELFIVTNVTGLTWTVTPGAEGTTQAAHASGATVTAIVTAGALATKAPVGVLMFPGPAVGEWIIGQALGGNSSTLLSNGTLLLVAIALSVPGTFDQIGWTVDTVGSAGSVIRLGLWAGNASGQPGTLLADAGTFIGTTTGLKQITFGAAQVLPAGLYWVGGVQQGAPTTATTMRTSSNSGGIGGGLVSSTSNQNNTTAPPLSYYATGITGALASNPTLVSNFSNGSPLISLHRSA